MTTSISFGGYQAKGGGDTVTGSQLAISMKKYFTDEWAYFFRICSASADGEHEEDGTTIDIDSNTTTLSGGVQWSYEIELDDDGFELTPFVGAGLSVQQYSYNYDYPDSEIGQTSGVGYGPLFLFGIKVDLSKHFVIIPGYYYDQVYIKSEEGESKSVTSSGVSLALVVKF